MAAPRSRSMRSVGSVSSMRVASVIRVAFERHVVVDAIEDARAGVELRVGRACGC